MRQGKVKAAPRLVDDNEKGGILSLNDLIKSNSKEQTVHELLFEQHPDGHPVHTDTIL